MDFFTALEKLSRAWLCVAAASTCLMIGKAVCNFYGAESMEEAMRRMAEEAAADD